MPVGNVNEQYQKYSDLIPVVTAGVVTLVELSNQYFGLAVCLMIFGGCVLSSRGRIYLFEMPGVKLLAAFFALGIVSGYKQIANGDTTWWPFARDILNMARIPLYWYLGAFYSDVMEHKEKTIYQTAFFAAFFLASFSITAKILFLFHENWSFNSFRDAGNFSEYVLAIGCFLIIFPPECCNQFFWSRKADYLAKVVIILASLISFSRTVLLILLCLCFFQINRQWKKTVAFLTVSLSLSFAISIVFPDAAALFWKKLVNSVGEMSSQHTRWTSTEIVTNWRGFEVYCAKKYYGELGVWGKIFGSGFGSAIDALGYSRLVTSESKLPFLHNGYYTTLFKLGIVGVCLNVSYYASYLLYALRVEASDNRKIVIGIVVAQCLTTAVTFGMLWSGCDLLSFLIMAWFMSYFIQDEDMLHRREQ